MALMGAAVAGRIGRRCQGDKGQRIRRVIEQELTIKQREIILAYYFQDKSIPEIAAERGIHKSSVCRCLQRAEKRVRHCLKY